MTVRELLRKHLDDFQLQEDGVCLRTPFRGTNIEERLLLCGWREFKKDVLFPFRRHFARVYRGQKAMVSIYCGLQSTWLAEVR